MRDGLVAAGHDVMAVSSEVVDDDDILSPPDSLSRVRRRGVTMVHSSDASASTRFIRSLSNLQVAHTVLNLARLPQRAVFLRKAIEGFQPDVVHALRLPYEGLTALASSKEVPVVVSTWGLDFEPMAARDLLLRGWIRSVLGRARGIHVDNPADYHRALEYGLGQAVPHIYAAGNFGLDVRLFHGADAKESGLVVFPRRAVPGINYRGFVKAIMELGSNLEFKAVGVGLMEVRDELVAEFGEEVLQRIDLTQRLDREDFADLMRRADVVVSPASWDGTPNTVIEAYLSGCRLVVGRLSQFEALLEAGMDMELVDPKNWREIHDAIRTLLTRGPGIRKPRSVPAEFDRELNKARISDFYEKVIKV
jgi:glycosyltransferase involved in cell wall biosynthesis